MPSTQSADHKVSDLSLVSNLPPLLRSRRVFPPTVYEMIASWYSRPLHQPTTWSNTTNTEAPPNTVNTTAHHPHVHQHEHGSHHAGPVSRAAGLPTAVVLGCGCGITTMELANRGFRAIGVDSDTTLLARAARRAAMHGGSTATFLTHMAAARAGPGGLAPGSASLVALMHCDKLEGGAAHEVLRQAHGLLKDGGRLVACWNDRDLSDPLVQSLEQQLEALDPHYSRSSHQHPPQAWWPVLSAGGLFRPLSVSHHRHYLHLQDDGSLEEVLGLTGPHELDTQHHGSPRGSSYSISSSGGSHNSTTVHGSGDVRADGPDAHHVAYTIQQAVHATMGTETSTWMHAVNINSSTNTNSSSCVGDMPGTDCFNSVAAAVQPHGVDQQHMGVHQDAHPQNAHMPHQQHAQLHQQGHGSGNSLSLALEARVYVLQKV